jgi:pantoate--beta-alanine ligase
MVADLNLPIEIVGMPIYREEDGLAMSSRNKYLTPPERKTALAIIHALRRASELFEYGERRAGEIIKEVKTIIEAEPLAQIDYVKICDTQTLRDTKQIKEAAVLAVAVNIGKARLIDNSVLDPLTVRVS